MAKLDNPKIRHRMLEAIRQTGIISDGLRASGLNSSTVTRFRNEHPEFDQAVLDAVQYYHVQQQLEYGQERRKKAQEYWDYLMVTQTLKHEVLYKYLFERDKRTG